MTNLALVKRKERCSYNVRKKNISKLKIVSMFRSNTNLYMHLSETDGKHIFSISTISKSAPKEVARKKNLVAAAWLGKAMAEKLKSMGIEKVVFDRCGYKFHGRVKEVVNSMKEGGIQCS